MGPQRIYRHLEAEALQVFLCLYDLNHKIIEVPGDIGLGQTETFFKWKGE
jgi:hypothetical protein